MRIGDEAKWRGDCPWSVSVSTDELILNLIYVFLCFLLLVVFACKEAESANGGNCDECPLHR
jgi:hypothetical protein